MPSAIKALREELSLSQPAMARLLGLSLAGYSNYERALRDPSPDTLTELSSLAEEYGLSRLGTVFEGALEKELEHRAGPATEQERAWSEAIVRLLRKDVLSPKMQREIIEILEGGKEIGDQGCRQAVIGLKVAIAATTEEKLKILADAHVEETGASPVQALTHILNQRPQLGARMELERTKQATAKRRKK